MPAPIRKGLVIGGAVALALVGAAAVASAKEAEDGGPSPLPPPPRERTPADMARQVEAHSQYGYWRDAHGFCLYPPQADPNDPNSYNVIAKAHNDACTFAETTWRRMMKDLSIPENQWDAVAEELT